MAKIAIFDSWGESAKGYAGERELAIGSSWERVGVSADVTPEPHAAAATRRQPVRRTAIDRASAGHSPASVHLRRRDRHVARLDRLAVGVDPSRMRGSVVRSHPGPL